MIVRLGYVAMSNLVKNASPSKRISATAFMQLADREAALRKLERIAEENLHNTMRLLKHNRAHDIEVFRFSSKLVPLLGHESVEGWKPIETIQPAFNELGDYVKKNRMRVSFHPDHFSVLNTPKADVLTKTLADLEHHLDMFEAMGLDERAKLVMHVGGTYGNKQKAFERFVNQFPLVTDRVKKRLTLENDDKSFTAIETLTLCEKLGLPMVLDIHHHRVLNQGEALEDLWPRIQATWVNTELPAKIHVSSPKSESDPRSHADFIDPGDLLPFLRIAKSSSSHLDVMIEAKAKDEALLKLMDDLSDREEVNKLTQSSFEI